MDCPLYQEAIQEQVDGTLGSIRTSELRIHLDQCRDCRTLLSVGNDRTAASSPIAIQTSTTEIQTQR